MLVDASDIAIGVVLDQCTEEGYQILVYYAPCRLSNAKHNYSMTKRKLLGLIYLVTKYMHYLLVKYLCFYVDHQALLYIINILVITEKYAH